MLRQPAAMGEHVAQRNLAGHAGVVPLIRLRDTDCSVPIPADVNTAPTLRETPPSRSCTAAIVSAAPGPIVTQPRTRWLSAPTTACTRQRRTH
jgi:hypothetical protein